MARTANKNGDGPIIIKKYANTNTLMEAINPKGENIAFNSDCAVIPPTQSVVEATTIKQTTLH